VLTSLHRLRSGLDDRTHGATQCPAWSPSRTGRLHPHGRS
jgi:hypothetical protein